VTAPESAVPLDPELPELLVDPEPPLAPEPPELPLDTEASLDPKLPELPLLPDPPLEEPPSLPLEPELLLDPVCPELPLESALLPDPEVDPLLASDALASQEKLELSPLEPQLQNVAVAAATAKAVRARSKNPSFPSSKALAPGSCIG
jgi:hypothetical protein